MRTIHCMKLNSPKHRLNTENQSLSASSFFNTQNCECWSSTTTSSPDSVIYKSSKSWKWTQIRCLALAKKELENCVRTEMRAEWKRLRANDCADIITADAVAISFPRTFCVKHKQHDKRESGLFKEEFRCTEMLCLCSKTYCCYDVTSNKPKFSNKGLNKRVLEQSGGGPPEKYRRVLNEKTNVTSNNRGLRTNNHSVATYEQVKKGLYYFYPVRLMEFTLNHLNCKTFNHFLFYIVMYLFNFIRSN